MWSEEAAEEGRERYSLGEDIFSGVSNLLSITMCYGGMYGSLVVGGCGIIEEAVPLLSGPQKLKDAGAL